MSSRARRNRTKHGNPYMQYRQIAARPVVVGRPCACMRGEDLNVADNRGHLLPVYILADESGSMAPYVGELDAGLVSLYETIRSEPMIAAKVRLSVLGFSDDVAVRLALADLRTTEVLPQLKSRGSTSYSAAFLDLLKRIPQDVATLKQEGYLIHRPAVFFLSDGQPNEQNWRDAHNQ